MIQEIANAMNKVSSGYLDDGSGRICDFYRVSDLVGAKVYRSLRCATLNHNSQRSLYKLGFAPEVLSEVIECTNVNVKRYLFLTELATTVREICRDENLHHDNDCDSTCDPNCDCDCYINHNFHTMNRFEDISVMMHELYKLNFHDDDQHWDNYGYLKDGTPVVIDCEFYHH